MNLVIFNVKNQPLSHNALSKCSNRFLLAQEHVTRQFEALVCDPDILEPLQRLVRCLSSFASSRGHRGPWVLLWPALIALKISGAS